MKVNKQNLGKVSITVEQDYWSEDKSYPKLTIVEVNNVACYLSRKFVPAGIEYSNREYWIRFSSNHISNIVDSLGISKRDGISQRVITEEFTKIDMQLSQFREFLDNIEDAELVSETTHYTSDDLTKDGNYFTNGEIAPTPDRIHVLEHWGCIIIDVTANDIIVLTSKGGDSARRWALTDKNLRIYDRALGRDDDPDYYNTIHYDEHIIPKTDGKLYVNCSDDVFNEFKVTVSNNALIKLINDVFEVNKGLVTDMEQVKQGKFLANTYDKTWLQYADVEPTPTNPEGKGGYYWAFLSYSDPGGTYEDLDEHAYYAPESPTIYASNKFGCNRMKVYAGEIYIISTVGGNRARAYAITDVNRRIKLISPSCNEEVEQSTWNIINNPITIEIEEDGYLYIDFDNSRGHTNDEFYIKKYINQIVDIENLKEKVNNLVGGEISKYKNNPLPIYNNTLKVLAIGNSYTDNPLEYLDDIISASGISSNNICIWRIIRSSARLGWWIEDYENDLPLPHSSTGVGDADRACSKFYGNLNMSVNPTSQSPKTMKEILSQDWDIIIFQQYSGDAVDYNTIEDDLSKFVRYVRENVTNQKVCIAWQSVWSYKSGYNGSLTSEERWSKICKASKEVVNKNGIDIIIPTGTAIQNARSNGLNNDNELTLDGTHLDNGVGRYIAACTWFETLIAPIFNVRLKTNSFIPTGGSVPVTNDNKELCQKCAIAAVTNRWELTEHLANNADSDSDSNLEPEPYEDDV